ncbi:hypothetical protein F383_05262 [Gossypium arboreum]|uniref:Uncharacterized protein n=1 Tax=Gossypium arboreum TaxID=29729 RepID=A0A0B0PN26_GOSAR|nr:hypothetical protein F383_05262 [Gossypium arboreum]
MFLLSMCYTESPTPIL